MSCEAERQHALLAALATGALPPGLRETGVRAERGLAAYRAHAALTAERALKGAFPTIQAMLGEQDFSRLSREFWSVHPPDCGDLGEWGGALPVWLSAHAELAARPWLADSAQLDLALHRCERAADARLDHASLQRLASDDPASLRLELRPGCALVESTWPIATLREAHRLMGEAREAALNPAREAIVALKAESVLVARDGWRAVAYRLEASSADFLRDLVAGLDLAAALTRAGAHFDFSAWLDAALRLSWLGEVRLIRPVGPLAGGSGRTEDKGVPDRPADHAIDGPTPWHASA